MRRDFIISSLCGVSPPPLERESPPRRDFAHVAQSGRRGGVADMYALVRELLATFNATSSPAERALALVQVLAELPCSARGELAVALTLRLAPHQLRAIARAGLLALEEAASLAEPSSCALVRQALAPALAQRPPPARMGDILVYAEGVSPQLVDCAVAELAHTHAAVSVLFIAGPDDGALSPLDWTDLLAAEARLSDDALLARFASQAFAGRVRVVPRRSLRAAAPLSYRLRSTLAGWWRRPARVPLHDRHFAAARTGQ